MNKTNANTIIFVIILIVSILSLGGLILLGKSQTPDTDAGVLSSNVTVVGDVQYLDMTAKAGYEPRTINAKAGIKTIIKMKTSNTFDCSSAVTIPKLNIAKNLPINGVTEIDLGTQTAGTEIKGTCTMGMYNFTIKFS